MDIEHDETSSGRRPRRVRVRFWAAACFQIPSSRGGGGGGCAALLPASPARADRTASALPRAPPADSACCCCFSIDHAGVEQVESLSNHRTFGFVWLDHLDSGTGEKEETASVQGRSACASLLCCCHGPCLVLT